MEILISIILLPFAIGSILLTACIGIGFVRGIKGKFENDKKFSYNKFDEK